MADKKTILIIDDEPDTRTYFSSLLEDNGYATVTAENGTEAIALVEKSPPDLITLDVTMPGMTGIEVLTKLRRSEGQGDIPVIVITGVARFRNLTEYRGVREPEAFLSKPIVLPDLLDTIRKLVGQ